MNSLVVQNKTISLWYKSLPLASNASVYLYPRVFDAPLQKSESVPAHLAPEGINAKEAYPTFRTDPMDSFNIFAGAFGTNGLRHLDLSLAGFLCVGCFSVVRKRAKKRPGENNP
jgi:hypothetical protein